MLYELIISTPFSVLDGEISMERYSFRRAWASPPVYRISPPLCVFENEPRFFLRMDVWQPEDGDSNLPMIRPAPRVQARLPLDILMLVTDFTALVYGKPFYVNGITSIGHKRMWPARSSVESEADRLFADHPCLNQYQRVDHPIDSMLTAIVPLLDPFLDLVGVGGKAIGAFLNALTSYAKALRNYREDPVAAFLAFITSFECLTGSLARTEPSDPRLEEIYGQIRSEFEDTAKAEAIIRFLDQQLYRVRRRLRAMLSRFVDKSFFERADHGVEVRLVERQFLNSMDRAYNLRSRYLHDGYSLQEFFTEMMHGPLWETWGVSITKKDAKDCLPTLLFIERASRHVLLQFFKTCLLPSLQPGCSP